MIYRQMNARDLSALTELWLCCFEESREAVDLFFKRNLSDTHGYLAEHENQPIAALYLIDCTLCGKKAHYLCGAATLPAYRGKGIMSALVEFALDDAKRRGDSFSALLPADDGLYRFYARLGYLPNGAASSVTLNAEDGTFEPGEPDAARLQAVCNGDNFLLWNKDFVDFAAQYYACYGVRVLKSRNALAFCEQDGGHTVVFYAIYNDIKELKALLYQNGVRRFTLIGGGENPLFQKAQPYRCGMIRPLDNTALPKQFYIGITLS